MQQDRERDLAEHRRMRDRDYDRGKWNDMHRDFYNIVNKVNDAEMDFVASNSCTTIYKNAIEPELKHKSTSSEEDINTSDELATL